MKNLCRSLLFLGLAFLLITPLAACGSPPSTAHLTGQQAISIIQVYGVPTLQPKAVPAGNWDAYYEDNGRWKVQGKVEMSYPSGDYVYHTTWIYDDHTVRMKDLKHFQ